MWMHKKNIINTLLIVVLSGLGVVLYLSWMREIPTVPISAILQDEKIVQKTQNKSQAIPGEATYKAVIEKNVFSPDRKEYVPEPAPLQTEEKAAQNITKILGKTIELQGIIQIGDTHSGLIVNPDIEAEKKYKWVVVGDQLGEFQVTEILPDKLMLRNGNEKYEIKLSDKKKKEMAAASPLKTTPPVVAAAPANKTAVTANKSKDKNSPLPTIQAKDENSRKETSEPSKDEKGSKETSVINTPFGAVKRKN